MQQCNVGCPRTLPLPLLLHPGAQRPMTPLLLPPLLLLQEAGKRLGSKAGTDEIKQHPWFAGINWALVRNQAPPFVVPRKSSISGEAMAAAAPCSPARLP